MRRLLLSILLLSIPLSLLAKQWPSDALAQLKKSSAIQIDCQFLSAMLGRDMSNEYPQRLLQAYKNAYPDYAAFENYTIQYRYSPDPIRVNTMKGQVRNCSFASVWGILEKNSPSIAKLKSSNPSGYNNLRSITISNLQSGFGSVEKFTEEMATSPSSANAKLERIAEQSARQMNSGNTPLNSTHNSRTISVPSNRIETNIQIWRVLSVSLSGDKTVINKQVVPKQANTWARCDRSEFIEDAETGRKYYIIGSTIGIDTQIKFYNTNPYSFSETYPALPSSVRYINISSGSQYYVKNLRVR